MVDVADGNDVVIVANSASIDTDAVDLAAIISRNSDGQTFSRPKKSGESDIDIAVTNVRDGEGAFAVEMNSNIFLDVKELSGESLSGSEVDFRCNSEAGLVGNTASICGSGPNSGAFSGFNGNISSVSDTVRGDGDGVGNNVANMGESAPSVVSLSIAGSFTCPPQSDPDSSVLGSDDIVNIIVIDISRPIGNSAAISTEFYESPRSTLAGSVAPIASLGFVKMSSD